MPELVHGTAVAFGEHGVLLRGPSGAGKSDLALRLISTVQHGLSLTGPGQLIADDQVLAEAIEGRVALRAPATIAGLLEVRGVGIVRLASTTAWLALVVDLIATGEVERLPEWPQTVAVCGVAVPFVELCGRDASAAAKVVCALDLALAGSLRDED